MDRRNLLAWFGGAGVSQVTGAAAAGTSLGTSQAPVVLAQASAAAPVMDHSAHAHHATAAGAGAPTPRKYDGLISPYQACTRAAQACIAHCQTLLAQGDKSLGECLRTALDAEAVCTAVIKLAGLNSSFTGALAKDSIAVMQACVEACKEHVDHHAECKACHDACVKAIKAARSVR